MRVNVYAEEMTLRVEIIEKQIAGQTFTGLRFYLELPVTEPCSFDELPRQIRGPFIHRPGDDDSSAVTFWGKRDLRVLLRKALAMLDCHYGGKTSSDQSQEPPINEAVARALIILRVDRARLLDRASLADPQAASDTSKLEEGWRPYLAEYDRAIRLCEDALQQAGFR